MSKGRRTHEARAMNLPPCPKCGAGRGECCMRRNGKARPAHSEREHRHVDALRIVRRAKQ